MITTPSNMKLYPDIHTNVHFASAAESLTGDGVFSNTDLIRIPYSGWLLVQGNQSATGDGLVYVPQINHQENRSNNLPVPQLAPGVSPSGQSFPWYKIWVEKGMTPRILYDEVTDVTANFTGIFFIGRNNPVGLNTPDIIVFKQVSATTQNVLSSTDLEDCPFPGYLLVWASSDQVDSQLQINQSGHQTGNYSIIPTQSAGLTCNILETPPYKTYVPATGNPTVTITEVTAMSACVLACFYIDWNNVPKSMIRRMGL